MHRGDRHSVTSRRRHHHHRLSVFYHSFQLSIHPRHSTLAKEENNNNLIKSVPSLFGAVYASLYMQKSALLLLCCTQKSSLPSCVLNCQHHENSRRKERHIIIILLLLLLLPRLVHGMNCCCWDWASEWVSSARGGLMKILSHAYSIAGKGSLPHQNRLASAGLLVCVSPTTSARSLHSTPHDQQPTDGRLAGWWPGLGWAEWNPISSVFNFLLLCCCSHTVRSLNFTETVSVLVIKWWSSSKRIVDWIYGRAGVRSMKRNHIVVVTQCIYQLNKSRCKEMWLVNKQTVW